MCGCEWGGGESAVASLSAENHQFALNQLQNVLGSTIIDNNLKVKKQ